MELFGIGLVTQMPRTKCVFSVPENGCNMQYLQAAAPPDNVDRKEQVQRCITSTAGLSVPFTRSGTTHLIKDSCFFCQDADGQLLSTVRTENAGKELRQAVQVSQDAVLMTRLSTAISPHDAHTINVRYMYHKPCWRRHVFHVLRDSAHQEAKSSKNSLSMQKSCLIELINLINIKTQDKAYLPMDVIETTCISIRALRGTDFLSRSRPAPRKSCPVPPGLHYGIPHPVPHGCFLSRPVPSRTKSSCGSPVPSRC